MKPPIPYDIALCRQPVGGKCATCYRNVFRYEPDGESHTFFSHSKEQTEAAKRGECRHYWEDKQ